MKGTVTLNTQLNAQPQTIQNQEQKNSEGWINVGYETESVTGTCFVKLPLGIPLDNIQPSKISNPDSDFGQLLLAQNGLLADLQKKVKEMQPGERLIIPLQVELYRKREEIQSEPSSSLYYKPLFK